MMLQLFRKLWHATTHQTNMELILLQIREYSGLSFVLSGKWDIFNLQTNLVNEWMHACMHEWSVVWSRDRQTTANGSQYFCAVLSSVLKEVIGHCFWNNVAKAVIGFLFLRSCRLDCFSGLIPLVQAWGWSESLKVTWRKISSAANIEICRATLWIGWRASFFADLSVQSSRLEETKPRVCFLFYIFLNLGEKIDFCSIWSKKETSWITESDSKNQRPSSPNSEWCWSEQITTPGLAYTLARVTMTLVFLPHSPPSQSIRWPIRSNQRKDRYKRRLCTTNHGRWKTSTS